MIIFHGYSTSTHFKTPLQYACWCGNKKMVRFLLENAVDPTIEDETGRDALAIANHFDKDYMVQILTEWNQKKTVGVSNCTTPQKITTSRKLNEDITDFGAVELRATP